ncbi:MAG: serine hydrolase domain-containing protein [Sphingopyxis sp.]|uniref:serine hydrolase domain-containing protein n=1 Tax=Sphingopyxis sp. TaxID=1908224 RepID=UPI002AB8731B|nr:serine hydrolase domain-containing protein [Sphingopyxis sp.]MDZ3833609.1 serine hydrolase domain-containing protein [Sphingopyxis sp.]
MIHFDSVEPRSERSRDALERFERVVSDFVERLGNLGALAAISVRGAGQVTVTAGHSDLEKTRAVQPDDIYQVGSQSKTAVAMALLLMSRDGLLDLDDPVHRFVDLPIDRRITVRNLLMNSSGIGECTVGGGPRFDMRLEYTPRDLVALALPQGQLFEPGSRFDYCNTGWIVAAMVIEAISGQPYGEVCDERIVRPLGLRNTAFGMRMPDGEPMRGYARLPLVPETIDMTPHLSWAYGAGDGVSNAADILAFYGSLLRPDSPAGVTLDDLAGHTLKPVAVPFFPMSLGTEYGLGLERRAWAGREVWGHPGSTGSCRTSTWIDAGLGVGVATAVTHLWDPAGPPDDLRYPRAQLFAMALDTAYALAADEDMLAVAG